MNELCARVALSTSDGLAVNSHDIKFSPGDRFGTSSPHKWFHQGCNRFWFCSYQPVTTQRGHGRCFRVLVFCGSNVVVVRFCYDLGFTIVWLDGQGRTGVQLYNLRTLRGDRGTAHGQAGREGQGVDILVATSSAYSLPGDVVSGHRVAVVPLSVLLNRGSFGSNVRIAHRSICRRMGGAKRLPGATTIPPTRCCSVFETTTSTNRDIIRVKLSSTVSSDCRGTILTTASFGGVCYISSGGLYTKVKLLILGTYSLHSGNFSTGGVTTHVGSLIPGVRSDFILSGLRFLRGNNEYDSVTGFNTGILNLGPIVNISPTANGVSIVGGCHNGSRTIYHRCVGSALRSVSGTSPSHLVVTRSNKVPNRVSTFTLKVTHNRYGFGRVVGTRTNYAVTSRYNPGAFTLFCVGGWYWVLAGTPVTLRP